MQIYQAEKFLTDIAHSTIVHFYDTLRHRIIAKGSAMQMDGYVFGSAMVVEIDESLFGKKQKYNRGKQTKKQWVFGLVEQKTRKTHFQCVTSRDRDTLFPIIAQHVKSGTMIWSDEWKAYHNLCDEGYGHGSVSHKYEFKSKDGVCTNTIEGSFHGL